jgi:hypothetical protein
MLKGGVTVFKAKFLSLFVTILPLALVAGRLCLGTKTGGMSDGGFTMN